MPTAGRTTTDGRRLREIVQSKRFATYANAQTYLDDLGPGPHLIVGRDPFRSCVPLPELTRFRLVHDEGTVSDGGAAVRIYRIASLRSQ